MVHAKNNKTANVSVSRSRLPYLIQCINAAEIDHIRFIAKSTGAINLKIDNTIAAINGPLWDNLFTAT